jgi:hypothetical protein
MENITSLLWMDYETYSALPLELLTMRTNDIDIENSVVYMDYNTFRFNKVVKLIPRGHFLYVLNYGSYRRLIITTNLELNDYQKEHLDREIAENIEFSLYGEM